MNTHAAGNDKPKDAVLGFKPLSLPNVLELKPFTHTDVRGVFVKLFHRPVFQAQGLVADFPETLVTISATGVVRGLHFQRPPHDHTKVIHCIQGAVMDVLVDLRRSSPSYKKCITVELSDSLQNGLYVPPGVAHGFYVRSGPATLMYHLSTVHAPEADMGIRWDSVPVRWPTSHPLISPRDSELPTLDRFDTPFE